MQDIKEAAEAALYDCSTTAGVIARLSAETGISAQGVREVFSAMATIVAECIGETTVKIPAIGSVRVSKHSELRGLNPVNGQPFVKPARMRRRVVLLPSLKEVR
jgi:nucleoid DNA-binding protein